MRRVSISRGLVATVDDEDYDLVAAHAWTATKPGRGSTWYAFAVIGGSTVYMHRLILGLDHGDRRVADHRNHDGLDNRRANLRAVTQTENMLNRRGPTRHNRSTGVLNIGKQDGRNYHVLVTVAGRRHSRYGFKTLEDAMRARDDLKRELGIAL